MEESRIDIHQAGTWIGRGVVLPRRCNKKSLKISDNASHYNKDAGR
jgi:hypothetical protein